MHFPHSDDLPDHYADKDCMEEYNSPGKAAEIDFHSTAAGLAIVVVADFDSSFVDSGSSSDHWDYFPAVASSGSDCLGRKVDSCLETEYAVIISGYKDNFDDHNNEHERA